MSPIVVLYAIGNIMRYYQGLVDQDSTYILWIILFQVTEKMEKLETNFKELEQSHAQAREEKDVLTEQLQQEREAFAEADEMRQRLSAKKAELEELLQDLESRVEEEEEKVMNFAEEKKKLQQSIVDLEDSWVVVVFILDIVLWDIFYVFSCEVLWYHRDVT